MKYLVCICTLLIAACSQLPADRPTLYQQLGEREGIALVVDNLLSEIADNPEVLPLFAKTDILRFRTQLTDHLCQLSDGPCVYQGDNMRDTHRGMNISQAQFNSLVENLLDAMAAANLPTATQNKLLARLVPLYPEVMNLPP